MKKVFANFVMFTIGAVIGSAVTWKLVKTKYEQIAQEEIDSVKETFSKRKKQAENYSTDDTTTVKNFTDDNVNNDNVNNDNVNNDAMRKDYESILKDHKYLNIDEDRTDEDRSNSYTKYTLEKTRKEDLDMEYNRPYVISPEEFDDNDEYNVISLTYYADGVLTDDMDEPIDPEDIDDLVGKDFADHFGEYEENSIFVRNDAMQTDYEILRDLQRYDER